MADRKYTSDYRLEKYVLPNGKIGKRRVYQGPEFAFCQSQDVIHRLGLTVLVCSAVVLVGLIPLLLTTSDISRTAYVLLPMAFSLFPLYQMFLVGGRLLRVQEPLTREMRDLTDKRLKMGSLWLMLLTGVTFLGSYLYWILQGLQAGDWLCLAGHTLGFAAAVLLFTREFTTIPWAKCCSVPTICSTRRPAKV